MGSSGRLITTADIADGAIMNVDVNASAAIAKSKLAALGIVDADVTGPLAVTKIAHVGAGMVLKSSGSANVGGQVGTTGLAVDAATQGKSVSVASAFTAVGSAGTWVYDPGLVLDMTLPVDGWMHVWITMNANCSVASSPVYFGLRRYGSGVAPASPIIHTFPVASQATLLTLIFAEYVTAGYHMFQVGLANYAGGYTTTVNERRMTGLAAYR